MAFLIPSAAKARHQYFDRTMSEAEAMLHDPAVVSALGQSAIDNFDTLFGTYYVPDIRNNTVRLPKNELGEKGIPVVPVAEGDTFILPERTKPFHPLQLVEMKNRLIDWGFNDSGSQSARAEIVGMSLRGPRKIAIDNGDHGAVDYNRAHSIIRHPVWDNPLRIQIFGAPHIILNMNTKAGELEEALTVVHETQHVLQIIGEPIAQDYQDYEGQYADIKEHEAIDLEETVQRALYTASKNNKYSTWAPLEDAHQK